MATRPSAAQRAAQAAEEAAAKNAADSAGNLTETPAAWGEVEEFYGHNLTDKADLIDTPFAIMGVEIERNEGKTYDVAYIYALTADGVEFEFSDTSDTGCRGQVQALLVERGLDPAPGAGFQKLPRMVVIRRGLRFNDYIVIDEESGKKKQARTYYLSASGRRPEEAAENKG